MTLSVRDQIRQAHSLRAGASAPKSPMFGSPEVAAYGALGLEDLTPSESTVEDDAPPILHRRTADGKRDVFELERSEPLPLIAGLRHHPVDNAHLWLGVEEGKLIVADDTDHLIMRALVSGHPPVVAALALADTQGLDAADAWVVTLKLVARLAAAGFIRGIRGYYAVKPVRPHRFARLHLTNRCQLECIHCYTNSGPNVDSAGELSPERWVSLVDAFADNGGEKILFTGGEALVYRGAIDIMRRAKKRGLEVTLFSNGILIKRHLQDLKDVVDIVQISLDGPGPESHDRVRGRNSFKKAIGAIHLLLDAGIETRVSTTIMTDNWPAIRDDFPKLIDRFKDTELGFRVSYGTMPHGRGTKLEHELDETEVRAYVDALLSRVKTSENRDGGRNVVQKIVGCGYAEQLVVAPDGVIYPCHLMSGALGHVDQMPLPDITHYLKRTAEAFSVDHRKGCGTCDLRNLCGGSCRVEDEKHTGSRLITTCTPEDKLRKKRFLVRRYRPVPAD